MTVIKKYSLLSRQGSSCWLATSRMQFLVKGNQPRKWFTVTVSGVQGFTSPLIHDQEDRQERKVFTLCDGTSVIAGPLGQR